MAAALSPWALELHKAGAKCHCCLSPLFPRCWIQWRKEGAGEQQQDSPPAFPELCKSKGSSQSPQLPAGELRAQDLCRALAGALLTCQSWDLTGIPSHGRWGATTSSLGCVAYGQWVEVAAHVPCIQKGWGCTPFATVLGPPMAEFGTWFNRFDNMVPHLTCVIRTERNTAFRSFRYVSSSLQIQPIWISQQPAKGKVHNTRLSVIESRDSVFSLRQWQWTWALCNTVPTLRGTDVKSPL